MADYNYNKPVDHFVLRKELPQDILDLLELVSSTDTTCTLTFSSALSAGQQTTLTNIIAAHPTDVSGDELKFYSLLTEDSPYNEGDPRRIPYDFDFTVHLPISLYKNVTFGTDGAPIRAEYYQTYDGTTYGNLLFKREFSFVRDGLSLAHERTEDFYAMRKDETWSPVYKSIHKYLTMAEQIEEAEQRRTKIIADLKVTTIGLLMMTVPTDQETAADMGRPFLSQYKPQIIDYIDEASTGFYNAVLADPATTYTWLENDIGGGVTIRQYILNAL